MLRAQGMKRSECRALPEGGVQGWAQASGKPGGPKDQSGEEGVSLGSKVMGRNRPCAGLL